MRLTDRNELALQRMQGPNFVVPVGSDQQQVPDVGLGHQVFDQIQSGRIEPLEIVEEQRERMLRARKHADEAPEHELEAALRILRRQVGQWRGLADDELDFGHQVHDEPCVRSQRLLQCLAPSASSASLFASSGRTRPEACTSAA